MDPMATSPALLSNRLANPEKNSAKSQKTPPSALQDIRVPFDLMAQDPRTEDPRNQDLKDFAKA